MTTRNAVIDIGVAYRENLDDFMVVMQSVATLLRQDHDFSAGILQDLEITGVNAWSDASIVIRARIRYAATEPFGVRRERLRRLKETFGVAHIGIPFPHVTVYAG